MVEPTPTDLLITGAQGQLGRALATAAKVRGVRARGRDLDTLDIRDPDAVKRWIGSSRPSTVINCAAFTAVDDCESHPDEAMAVNGIAVGHLASACNQVGALLVQVSTDYVFDGRGQHPYAEDEPAAPLNVYGHSKLRGEELARSADRHLIVRSAWLFGHSGRNFVDTIRSRVSDGTPILKVVVDQRGCPTYCDDLAESILDLVAARAHGVVHAVNSGDTSWYGLAKEIARLLAVNVEILPVPTDEFPRPARRPAFSVLDTSRLVTLLGRPMPSWQDALRRYLEESCES
jgi:dTDP-4-dehydrorhamnose reductase